jgi:hypothetical protein
VPRWLPGVLRKIAELAGSRRVSLTLKARRELAILGLGLDEEDALDVLVGLRAEDSAGRLASATTGEWMYLFKPTIAGTILYVKLMIRNDCIVVSFHEDEGNGHGEEEDDE